MLWTLGGVDGDLTGTWTGEVSTRCTHDLSLRCLLAELIHRTVRAPLDHAMMSLYVVIIGTLAQPDGVGTRVVHG